MLMVLKNAELDITEELLEAGESDEDATPIKKPRGGSAESISARSSPTIIRT